MGAAWLSLVVSAMLLLSGSASLAAYLGVVDEGDARKSCPPYYRDHGADPTAPCPIDEFGLITTIGGRSFFYGLYKIGQPETRLANRLAIYERVRGTGRLQLLFAIADEEGAFYFEKPVLLHSGSRLLMYVQGRNGGTYQPNGEQVFAWKNGDWVQLDTTSWLGDLDDRLPHRIFVSWGIYPDYQAMTAVTPLWHYGDGNCCLNAGRAYIGLVWRGDTLAINSLRVLRGRKYICIPKGDRICGPY